MSRKDKKQSTDFHHFIDTHLRELRWTSYGLGAVAALIILRNLRASKKFVTIDQIPSNFITKNYTLQGHVRKITNSGVLQIEHTPIIELKWISRCLRVFRADDQDQFLHVLPAGLDLTADAIQWLNTNASGKHAWFQMMMRDEEFLYCDIRVKKGYFGRMNISNELLKNSICKVHHFESPPDGDYFNKYLIKLISLESKAAQRGKGIWKEDESWMRRKTGSVFNWGKDKLKRLFKKEKD